MADFVTRKCQLRSSILFWKVRLWTWEWKGRLAFALWSCDLLWTSTKIKFMGWNNILQIFVSIVSSCSKMTYNFPGHFFKGEYKICPQASPFCFSNIMICISAKMPASDFSHLKSCKHFKNEHERTHFAANANLLSSSLVAQLGSLSKASLPNFLYLTVPEA